MALWIGLHNQDKRAGLLQLGVTGLLPSLPLLVVSPRPLVDSVGLYRSHFAAGDAVSRPAPPWEQAAAISTIAVTDIATATAAAAAAAAAFCIHKPHRQREGTALRQGLLSVAFGPRCQPAYHLLDKLSQVHDAPTLRS
jgi:hypothetical protein